MCDGVKVFRHRLALGWQQWDGGGVGHQDQVKLLQISVLFPFLMQSLRTQNFWTNQPTSPHLLNQALFPSKQATTCNSVTMLHAFASINLYKSNCKYHIRILVIIKLMTMWGSWGSQCLCRDKTRLLFDSRSAWDKERFLSCLHAWKADQQRILLKVYKKRLPLVSSALIWSRTLKTSASASVSSL